MIPRITKEWLYEEYVVKNRRAEDIAKELGCCKQNISFLANTKYKFHKRRRVVKGDRFGKLVVQDPYFSNDEFGHPVCLCVCDCGTQNVKVVRGSLLNQCTRSCGCLRPNQSPEHDYISKYTWKNIRQGAKARNIKLLVTIQQIWELFEKQDGVCALSGLPIIINETASLDRIDSTKDYTIDNIQWVHKHINMAKQSYPQEYFIKLCKLVAGYCK